MEDDSGRFGRATWSAMGEQRLQDFKELLSKEKIQLLQAKREYLKHGLGKKQQEVLFKVVIKAINHTALINIEEYLNQTLTVFSSTYLC